MISAMMDKISDCAQNVVLTLENLYATYEAAESNR